MAKVAAVALDVVLVSWVAGDQIRQTVHFSDYFQHSHTLQGREVDHWANLVEVLGSLGALCFLSNLELEGLLGICYHPAWFLRRPYGHSRCRMV